MTAAVAGSICEGIRSAHSIRPFRLRPPIYGKRRSFIVMPDKISREEIEEGAEEFRVEERAALHPALPSRLKARSPGLGEGSQCEIESRAVELALIDGRDAATDEDLARAAAELSGGGTIAEAPEADPALRLWTEATDPQTQTGRLIEAVPLQDEDNIAEQLIEDGLEEAEHDSRVAAEYAEKDTGTAEA